MMSQDKVKPFILLTVNCIINKIQKMGCIDSQPNQNNATHMTRARTPKSSRSSYKKPIRLVTFYAASEIREITDEQRKAGFKPIYTCPICTLRFNKILACEECNNCICLTCYLTYEQKAKRNFKCSFCGSETSLFKDYEKEAHSYFDTTGNGGFLTPDERKKIDQEIGSKSPKKGGSILQPIVEVEAG